MTNIETSKHYNGEVTIKFYPDSHRYQLEGKKDYLLGVTTCTGMSDKSRALIIWATRLSRDFLLDALAKGETITEDLITQASTQHDIKREEAANKGSLVHAYAENYIKGIKQEIPEDENVSNGILAFLKWVNENDIKFIASEKRIYSRKYGYVGTMDCSFTMGKEDHKIIHAGDFKTSNNVYLEMCFQVSAYQEADTEEHGTVYGDKYIIRFDKETAEFEVHPFPAEEHQKHFEGFLARLKLKEQSKEWDKLHGYYSPKEVAKRNKINNDKISTCEKQNA